MRREDVYELPVKAIMAKNPPLIPKDAPLAEVGRVVLKQHHVWVVEEKGSRKVLGIISETDLLDVISPMPQRTYVTGTIRVKSLRHGQMETAQDIMTKPPLSCHPDTTLEEALRLMTDRKIRRLAVLDQGEIVGQVCLKTLIRTFFHNMHGVVPEPVRDTEKA